jgi:hypothetical protein
VQAAVVFADVRIGKATAELTMGLDFLFAAVIHKPH